MAAFKYREIPVALAGISAHTHAETGITNQLVDGGYERRNIVGRYHEAVFQSRADHLSQDSSYAVQSMYLPFYALSGCVILPFNPNSVDPVSVAMRRSDISGIHHVLVNLFALLAGGSDCWLI